MKLINMMPSKDGGNNRLQIPKEVVIRSKYLDGF